MAIARKKSPSKNEKAVFGSAYTLERLNYFEQKAKSDPDFALLFDEYRSIFNESSIRGVLVLQNHLKFMEEKLEEAKESLPGFVNETLGKKKSKDDDKEQDEAYDIKAWDRYDKILSLYTKTLQSEMAQRKTLTKADLEIAEGPRSIIGSQANGKNKKA